MTCAEVQRVLPEGLENVTSGEFEAHLKVCPGCSELVADLKLISSEARWLAESEEPAPRVWVRIAAQLRAEGLIREPEVAPVPVSAPRRRWAWLLVPAVAALIAGSAYVVNHRTVPQVAVQQAPASSVQTPAEQTAANQVSATSAQAPAVAHPAPQNARQRAEVAEAPSPEDQQFLSEVSQGSPSMRATYEDQLRAVNAYIREAQAYVDQNPGDEDARQHLMEAYQQKALLYQLALERIQ